LVTSFNWFELIDFYSIDQKTRIGVLTQKLTKDSLALAKSVKAFSIHPREGNYKQKWLEKAIKQGFKVKPWQAEIPVFESEVEETEEVLLIPQPIMVEEVVANPAPEAVVL